MTDNTDYEDLFRVGVLLKPHGLKGELNVYPTTDDPERFKNIPEVLLKTEDGYIKLHIRSARPKKNLMIIGFKEFTDINQVERFEKCELFVTRENAIPLEEGEYYIKDLIGLSVYLTDGSLFGTLTDVLKTGANDVYSVDVKGKEVLIPVIPDCIREVDIENKRVTVFLLPGLYEE